MDIKVPAFRKLIAFKGSFEEVSEQLTNYKGTSELEDWAEVMIEEQVLDTSIRAKFETLIEDINKTDNQLLIIKPCLRFVNDNQLDDYEAVNSLADLSINDVFDNLLSAKKVHNQESVSETFAELMDHFFHQSENE